MPPKPSLVILPSVPLVMAVAGAFFDLRLEYLMSLHEDTVSEVLGIYVRAWETQDPDLVVTIFTPDATYHERVLGDPIPDREAIRRYWQAKVVEAQANITCKILQVYICGLTVIAEWEALFDDLEKGVRKRMREIAVLEFRGNLVSSLREYWASEPVGQLGAEEGRFHR
jgi:hypothetical protein